jgi:hypothetical protein
MPSSLGMDHGYQIGGGDMVIVKLSMATALEGS